MEERTQAVETLVRTKEGTREEGGIEKRTLPLKNEAIEQTITRKKVNLNVGGRYFLTSPDTLCREPGSMLAMLVSGRWQPSYDDNAFFIDRDPQMFELILQYLRTSELPPIKEKQHKVWYYKQLLKEAQFFLLSNLEHIIKLKLGDHRVKTKMFGPEAVFNRKKLEKLVVGMRRMDQPVDLTGFNLAGLDLYGFGFKGAVLNHTNFEGASLRRVSFVNAKLNGAILRGADLRHADLRGADLRKADLQGADLTESKLCPYMENLSVIAASNNNYNSPSIPYSFYSSNPNVAATSSSCSVSSYNNSNEELRMDMHC